MAKKIQGYIKLQVKAGQANPSPPIGPALGQHGVNIMEFCKAFNAETQSKNIENGAPVPVVITVYSDKSFSFTMKKPPVSFLLKKAAKVKAGSANPSKDIVGSITYKQVEEIAMMKESDLTASSKEAAINIVKGSARSMGIRVEGEKV